MYGSGWIGSFANPQSPVDPGLGGGLVYREGVAGCLVGKRVVRAGIELSVIQFPHGRIDVVSGTPTARYCRKMARLGLAKLLINGGHSSDGTHDFQLCETPPTLM